MLASAGKMKFIGSGFFGYLKDVAWIHATARHDDDASVRLFYQFLQHRDAGRSIGFETGSQDAVATQFDDLFQSFLRVAAHVESTVESHAHVAHGIHQLLHGRHVHIAFGSQATEDYTIGTQLAGHLDVMKHDFLF